MPTPEWVLVGTYHRTVADQLRHPDGAVNPNTVLFNFTPTWPEQANARMHAHVGCCAECPFAIASRERGEEGMVEGGRERSTKRRAGAKPNSPAAAGVDGAAGD